MFPEAANDDPVECPLCMETLEIDDVNFFPCTCGYQICRFCWHRIRTDENGLCPACRKAYPECPADFKPLSEEELQRIKTEKRQKDIQRKQKITENRKHLASVRVVQKNLVFVVGLSQRLADTEILKKQEYFGKFGKILKVVINPNTSYAGAQGPSASAYVTYQRQEDALRAIQAVNNVHVDGRTLKASLGTTKYCSHFLKNSQCPKQDCMYLHELGDEAASFTKEDMQQGKHQEYEQKLLQDVFKGSSHSTSATASGGGTNHTQSQTNHNTVTTEGPPEASRAENINRVKQASPPLLSQSPQNGSKDPWPSLLKEQSNGMHTNGGQDLTATSSREPLSESVAIPIRPSSSDIPRQSQSHTPDIPVISNSPLLSSSENSLSPVGDQGIPQQQTMKALFEEKDTSSSFFSGGQFLPTVTNTQQPPPPGLGNAHPLSAFNGWGEGLGGLSNDILPVDTQTDWQAAFGFDSEEKDPKDDDLGFDPWNESSKGLAALLETELQLSEEQKPPLPPVSNTFSKPSSFSAMMTQPPPGFVLPPNHVLPFSGANRQPPRQDMGGSKMFTWMQVGPPGMGQPLMFPSLPPSSTLPSHDLHSHHMRYPPQMQQTSQQKLIPNFQPMHQQQEATDRQSIKSKREHLRGLLPNINVHFDTMPDFPGLYSRESTHYPTTNGTANGSMWGSHSVHIQDPAIVSINATGATTTPSPKPTEKLENGLPDEQPHWMESLKTLTDGESPTQTHTNSLFPTQQIPQTLQRDIFS